MSIRHQYSYWLTAEDPGRTHPLSEWYERVLAAMLDAGIAGPGNALSVTRDDATLSLEAEVQPQWGTVEQDDGIPESVGKIAAQFPHLSFTLMENDEEDRSVQCLRRWENGTLAEESHARIIPADERYDRETVEAVAEFVRDEFQDMGAVADAILDAFRNRQN